MLEAISFPQGWFTKKKITRNTSIFQIKGNKNGTVPGEYTFLYMLHRLSYLETIQYLKFIDFSKGQKYLNLLLLLTILLLYFF